MPAVIIAAVNLLPALRERLAGEGDLLTFSDSEPIQALQAILERRPPLIVLERLFAATPRGGALITRIKTDPQLAHAEIRVMSPSGDYMRQVTKPQAPAEAAAAAVTVTDVPLVAGAPGDPEPTIAQVLDWHGTRRAARVRVRDGVEILLDGNPARVVDLSMAGAQVISPTILRPNQKVRVGLGSEESVMRFRGAIAWATFELTKASEPPRYRAGVEFFEASPRALEHFCARYRA